MPQNNYQSFKKKNKNSLLDKHSCQTAHNIETEVTTVNITLDINLGHEIGNFHSCLILSM